MALTIAIDGPVGAGKSAVARRLAAALGILHLDTGAMYRAVGLKALRAQIDPRDTEAVEALLAQTTISVSLADGRQLTRLDGEDVTGLIRTEEVSAYASAVSTVPAVRSHMVALQQRLASQSDMVLDGRDIGTRVLPNATFKFFLTAKPEARAERRYMELKAKKQTTSYEQVLADLLARDKQDCERAVDPLRPAQDARMVDTTSLNEDEVVSLLFNAVRKDTDG